MSYDLILKDGRVLDPATGADRVCDIGIRNGKIAALGEEIDAEGSAKRENLSGLIVTPGLIDIHLHAFGSLGFLHPDTLVYRFIETYPVMRIRCRSFSNDELLARH